MPTTLDHRAPSRPVPDGSRRCIAPACVTILSAYNAGETCYLHTARRFPRNGVRVGRPSLSGIPRGRISLPPAMSRVRL